MTAADLCAVLKISKTTKFRIVRELQAQGVIETRGTGRSTCYVAPGTPSIPADPAAGLPARQRAALDLAARLGGVTRLEYERATQVGPRTAKRDLADLVTRGLLVPTGSGKLAGYQVSRGVAKASAPVALSM